MSRSTYTAPGPYAPPPIDPAKTRVPTCSKCGRDLVFVVMHDTGKRMPCDPGMQPGDGKKTLVVRWERGRDVVGRVMAKAPETATGLEPHFGTCPCRPRTVALPDPRPIQPSLFDPPSDG